MCSLCIYMYDLFVCTHSRLLIISEVASPPCPFFPLTSSACSPSLAKLLPHLEPPASLLPARLRPRKGLDRSHFPFPLHWGACEPTRVEALALKARGPLPAGRQAGSSGPPRLWKWGPHPAPVPCRERCKLVDEPLMCNHVFFRYVRTIRVAVCHRHPR